MLIDRVKAFRALAALGGSALVLALASPASAHDHWISHAYPWCCGEQDCGLVQVEGVRIVQGGYLIVQTGEVIPQDQALPSDDGQFWRCQYLTGSLKGKTRCFFRGAPQS